MAIKDGSVAPQERINIKYKPATGDAQDECELPLKMLFVGDYTGRPDPRPLEERKPIHVDKDNFQQVLGAQNLSVNIQVPNKLSEEPGAELGVSLWFKSLSDFRPEAIAEQVPELKELVELRTALTALKGPLGNDKSFRDKITLLLRDEAARKRLMGELGIEQEEVQ